MADGYGTKIEFGFPLRYKEGELPPPNPRDFIISITTRIAEERHKFAERLGVPVELIDFDFLADQERPSNVTVRFTLNPNVAEGYRAGHTNQKFITCPVCDNPLVHVDEERIGDYNHGLVSSEAGCRYCEMWERKYQTGVNYERVGWERKYQTGVNYERVGWEDFFWPDHPTVYEMINLRGEVYNPEGVRIGRLKSHTGEARRLFALTRTDQDFKLLYDAAKSEDDTPALALADRLNELGLCLTETSLRHFVRKRAAGRQNT